MSEPGSKLVAEFHSSHIASMKAMHVSSRGSCCIWKAMTVHKWALLYYTDRDCSLWKPLKGGIAQ